jgi:excisionase family DNA binding protein
MPEPLLVTPKEAAKLLAISRSKTYELIAKNKLPSITLGYSRRIPLDALRALIKEQTTTDVD